MTAPPLRLLVVAESWVGGNGRGFAAALRRAGHRVTQVDPQAWLPGGWSSTPLRVMGRVLRGRMIADLTHHLLDEIASGRHDALVAYKGQWVAAEVLDGARRAGRPTVNVYPDNSVEAHGRTLAAAISHYDVVFTTKRFHLRDLADRGVSEVHYLPHGFDPDVHRPPLLTADDAARYGCDLAFVGTWSPKKQALLEHLTRALPDATLRVWGAQWERAPGLRHVWQGRPALGWEYAVAVASAAINLAITSEARAGSSSGDTVTARTFEIPAMGAMMLHERTADLLEWFDDGTEVATFDGADELVRVVRDLRADPGRRARIAAAGQARVEAGSSLDHRAAVVAGWIAARLAAPGTVTGGVGR